MKSLNNTIVPLKLLSLVISAIMLVCFCGCDSDDDSLYDDIVGSWYGTRAYYNPVGGTKYQYLTVRFESNGTGSLEYEAPTSYSAARFTYSVNGSLIRCKGAYANTYGDIDGDFTLDLRIEGNRLIPVNLYNFFILTKDNSVITDGDGNELANGVDLIYGVWKHSSGNVILVLSDSYYEEYTLMTGESNIYSNKSEGSFSYNNVAKYVLINGHRFDVTLLTETVLQLMSEDNNIFNYTRGSTSDIPTNGQNSNNYSSILENSRLGWCTKSGDRLIKFYGGNQVHYIEQSSKPVGSLGYINLIAEGTYSLSGKTINSVFNDVWWDTGNSSYFPDWTYGATCYKTFTIEDISVERLTLKYDGKSYIFYNSDI